MIVYLKKSNRNDKKYIAEIHDHKPMYSDIQKVYFGDTRYEDYTTHKDDKRKERYIARHRSTEDWTKKGIRTAGFWSRWILWNQPTVEESIDYLNRKYKDVKIYMV